MLEKSAMWGMPLYSGDPTGVPPVPPPVRGRLRNTATYPLGPHQEDGNPIWEQGSVFQPWRQPTENDPFWGMPMYGGFVETQYPIWVPSYQPGMETSRRGQELSMYSGFVNEHNMEGI